MADIVLSCPDGYQLACAKDSKKDRCCFCCVHIDGAKRSFQKANIDLVSSP
jgi:hypothetical protein